MEAVTWEANPPPLDPVDTTPLWLVLTFTNANVPSESPLHLSRFRFCMPMSGFDYASVSAIMLHSMDIRPLGDGGNNMWLPLLKPEDKPLVLSLYVTNFAGFKRDLPLPNAGEVIMQYPNRKVNTDNDYYGIRLHPIDIRLCCSPTNHGEPLAADLLQGDGIGSLGGRNWVYPMTFDLTLVEKKWKGSDLYTILIAIGVEYNIHARRKHSIRNLKRKYEDLTDEVLEYEQKYKRAKKQRLEMLNELDALQKQDAAIIPYADI